MNAFEKRKTKTPKSSKTKKDNGKELEEIYGLEENEEIDFSSLEQRKKKGFASILAWVVVGLAIVSLLGWIGYFLFQSGFGGNETSLQLVIEGESQVTSGEETSYKIRYKNTGSVGIQDVQIELKLPDGFVIGELSPEVDTTEWFVSAIGPGSDGVILINGIWREEVPSVHTLQAIGSYMPVNFNSQFQSIETLAVNVSESVIDVSLEGPNSATTSDSIEYTIRVKNTGSESSENVLVALAHPDEFTISSSSFDKDEEYWVLDTIAAGEEVEILVNGNFSADATDLAYLQAVAGFLQNEHFVKQVTSERQTDIVASGLRVQLIAAGSTNAAYVDPGETLRVTASVRNAGDGEVALSDLELEIDVDNQTPVDWDDASLDGGSRSGAIISWNEDDFNDEGLLEPDDEVSFDLLLPMVSDASGRSDSFTLQLSAILSGDEGSNFNTSPMTVYLNSDTSFDASAYYYENSLPVGSGTMPPTVGETTTYHLSWSLSNTLHALDNVSVQASLPPAVQYVGEVNSEIGAISYNPSTRILTWFIDQWPVNLSAASTTFEVSITPTSEDVGTFIKLMNESSLAATDMVTNATISRSDSELTTNLVDDPSADGLGIVVE